MSETKKPATIIKKTQKDDRDLTNISLSDEDLSDMEDVDVDADMDHVPRENAGLAAEMLNFVLGNHFNYCPDGETRLNVADILVLIKDSIDKNSKCLLRLANEIKSFKQDYLKNSDNNPQPTD